MIRRRNVITLFGSPALSAECVDVVKGLGRIEVCVSANS
jgi:hypothetical protein